MLNQYPPIHTTPSGHIRILDQTLLPSQEEYKNLRTSEDIFNSIANMNVRGAGIIGNVAAFGVYLASLESNGNLTHIQHRANWIKSARPTAVNLNWAVDRMLDGLEAISGNPTEYLKNQAELLLEEEKTASRKIGEYGFALIHDKYYKKDRTVNILTHCNAGALAIYDRGSALAPIYQAHEQGISVHVWVDETRPRNQGSNLTAWELEKSGIPFTLIADNTGGLLMQRGDVDLVFVGADRVTRNGDVVNKIGTYLKALSAHDNEVPFYVLFPTSTFDLSLADGREVPIEERNSEEMTHITGITENGELQNLRILNETVNVKNYGFDITPSRLITGLVTEKGICSPSKEAIGKVMDPIFERV